jgi:hypothetical protein
MSILPLLDDLLGNSRSVVKRVSYQSPAQRRHCQAQFMHFLMVTVSVISARLPLGPNNKYADAYHNYREDAQQLLPFESQHLQRC